MATNPLSGCNLLRHILVYQDLTGIRKKGVQNPQDHGNKKLTPITIAVYRLSAYGRPATLASSNSDFFKKVRICSFKVF